jgi:hypothetical protein
VAGELAHHTLIHEKKSPVPGQKVPIAVRAEVKIVGVAVNGGKVCPADRVARGLRLELRDAVPSSLQDGVVQLQIGERLPQRRLALGERCDAAHIGSDEARSNHRALK